MIFRVSRAPRRRNSGHCLTYLGLCWSNNSLWLPQLWQRAVPSKAAKVIGHGCLGPCAGIVETAWALQKALQLISHVCCGCRSAALTCEQPRLALVMMLFTYKGVFTCHPDVGKPPAGGSLSLSPGEMQSSDCGGAPWVMVPPSTGDSWLAFALHTVAVPALALFGLACR